jgi:3-methyl-2-oxobutanoate hydroxymethyltransferase
MVHSGDRVVAARQRVTISTIQKMKRERQPIAALSIYDTPWAKHFEETGGDLIIVGDSAEMTVHGRQNTLSMTMDKMIIHVDDVRRGAPNLFVVGDMPLGSYEPSDEQAVRNALRFVSESRCNAVKIETNNAYISRVRAIADACLVIAHIGLNPNKAEMLGGYRVLGKTRESIANLRETAVLAERAGAAMILIETVAEEAAQFIAEAVGIPVIGIGAGRYLDGQLMISHDLLGLYDWPGTPPRHAKAYKTTRTDITPGEALHDAFTWYVHAVKSREFPGDGDVHKLPTEDLRGLEEFRREIHTRHAGGIMGEVSDGRM